MRGATNLPKAAVRIVINVLAQAKPASPCWRKKRSFDMLEEMGNMLDSIGSHRLTRRVASCMLAHEYVRIRQRQL
jgi:hypothetical protein|tara:strand:+ start:1929 stop:2153 length:225 start_codon:yes stop_codon:yes gene_type:complete